MGGLLSYDAHLADLALRGAQHVDKILRAQSPVTCPVEQPTKFELVINLKTAKALGITVPKEMLLRADEVMSKIIWVIKNYGSALWFCAICEGHCLPLA